MDRFQPLEVDSYLLEEQYSDVGSDSSDDEVQEAMRAVLDTNRSCMSKKSRRVHEPTTTEKHAQQADAEEFESDMDSALSVAFDQYTAGIIPKTSQSQSKPPVQPKMLDTSIKSKRHVTFEEPHKPVDTKKKRDENKKEKNTKTDDDPLELEEDDDSGNEADSPLPQPSNDELLYDPEEDSANQRWVDQKRMSNRRASDSENDVDRNGKDMKAPHSDAVLNCPACMATLCRDCQRHSTYKTQYRAMFVENCTIETAQVLYMPQGPSRKARKKHEATTGLKYNDRVENGKLPENVRPSDLFKPVTCTICKTEVGVYDCDEIYHFFNVLSGYC